jgi:hypothetical protein
MFRLSYFSGHGHEALKILPPFYAALNVKAIVNGGVSVRMMEAPRHKTGGSGFDFR